MRIVPLLPSSCAPDPWQGFGAAELVWTGTLNPGWIRPAGRPSWVHALHLPAQPWGSALGETALTALRPDLGADFLVLRAGAPGDRIRAAAFLEVLEGLLEATQGTDLKLALRPDPGAAPELVARLREARGEVVGFCWDAGNAGDLEAFSDRLFCAVGQPGDDFGPIQRLGYRWNLAVPAQDPATFETIRADILRAFPPVLFPAGLDQDPAPESHP